MIDVINCLHEKLIRLLEQKNDNLKDMEINKKNFETTNKLIEQYETAIKLLEIGE